MKKKVGIALALFLSGFVFIFAVWPCVEFIGSIFHSRPSNPWEYYKTYQRAQEHLEEYHPGYSITEMEYMHHYFLKASNGNDEFTFDIFEVRFLYCHHPNCNRGFSSV